MRATPDLIPIYVPPNSNELVTSFTMSEVDERGMASCIDEEIGRVSGGTAGFILSLDLLFLVRVRFLDLVTGNVRRASGRHEGRLVEAVFSADGGTGLKGPSPRRHRNRSAVPPPWSSRPN